MLHPPAVLVFMSPLCNALTRYLFVCFSLLFCSPNLSAHFINKSLFVQLRYLLPYVCICLLACRWHMISSVLTMPKAMRVSACRWPKQGSTEVGVLLGAGRFGFHGREGCVRQVSFPSLRPSCSECHWSSHEWMMRVAQLVHFALVISQMLKIQQPNPM